MRDDDYRPAQEPFGANKPDFIDTVEPDNYPDDMLQDEPPEALRETTDDPEPEDELSEEDVTDRGGDEEPSNGQT